MANDREIALADRRAQLANNAATVFITLNVGTLAGVLTWMQSFPLASEGISCHSVLISRMPLMCGLLLLGVLSATASYFVRYRSGDPGRIQLGWQIALGLSALALVTAGATIGYTVTNCQVIAANTKIDADLDASMHFYDTLSGTEKVDYWDGLRQRGDEASTRLRFAIVEASLRERTELERMIHRVREIKGELIKRLEAEPNSKKLKDDFLYASELEEALANKLSE